jgi:hypothetical protein
VLLLPAVAGLIAFGGSGASLHDGVGQRTWEPVAAPASSYRLAFGQGVLNLSQLQPQSGPRTIHVTMAGGQVRIVAPRSMAVTVSAHIRFGVLSTAAAPTPWQRTMVANGAGVNRTIVPPAAATGQPIRVVVDLADGEVEVVRR